ncbi:MAG TPA: type II restriction endonuclease subunit M [Deltaproteobacteria bacterium]|nr:type II restriction endonuclease subunit M [Deltaproteobacteria bacterium]
MNHDAPTRYQQVSSTKATGATYTPPALARFVAERLVEQVAAAHPIQRRLRIADPAVGEGELLVQIVHALHARGFRDLDLYGFDVNADAVAVARSRLAALDLPEVTLVAKDFLSLQPGAEHLGPLFRATGPAEFDVIIANPPYVRTQVLGAAQARRLAEAHGLRGRVDLYQAFLLVLAEWLASDGVAGVITSNRYLTVRSGETVRRHLWQSGRLHHVWDLGDTRCFGAAVLPAVTLLRGANPAEAPAVGMTTIYEAAGQVPAHFADTVFDALALDGFVQLADHRIMHVRQGTVVTEAASGGVWRLSNAATEAWLQKVADHTWKTFEALGKIRVGIKTTADAVFIRDDWQGLPTGVPELLRPLTTHHVGQRYRAAPTAKSVLYTHEMVDGRRRAVHLERHPVALAYLETHRARLEGRAYVAKAGRAWFEIWVPHQPDQWERPKMVFRDITDEPQFWVDLDGTVVNGDCYWVACDNLEHLWLATAVGNSSFIGAFYDRRFNNKLYAGRRRFITQYVRHFPLPDPSLAESRAMMARVAAAYERGGMSSAEQAQLDRLVWAAFGLEAPQASSADTNGGKKTDGIE